MGLLTGKIGKETKEDVIRKNLKIAMENLERRRIGYNQLSEYYNLDFKSGYWIGLIHSFARSIAPQIVLSSPRVSLTPPPILRMDRQVAMQSFAVQEYMNAFYEETKFARKLKQMVIHGFVYGLSGLAVGYKDLLVQDRQGSSGETYVDVIQNGKPFVNIIHPSNILFDPYCTDWDFDTAMWLGRVIYKPAAVWHGMRQRFGDKVKDIKDDEDLRQAKSGDKMPVATVYEIYDRQTNAMLYFHGSDFKLFHYESVSPLDEQGPFVIYSPNPGINGPLGPSDAMALEPQQLELNDVMATLTFLRRMNIVKMMYNQNAISKDDFERIIDGELVGAVPVQGNPREAVSEFNVDIPPIYQYLRGQIESDASLSAGFSRNAMGAYAPGYRSAEEARQVGGADRARLAERMEDIGDVVVNVCKRQLRLLAAGNQLSEQVLLPSGQVYPVPPQAFNIPYYVSISPETMAPRTMVGKARDALGLLQTLVPLAQAMPQVVAPMIPILVREITAGAGYEMGVIGGAAAGGAPPGGPQGGPAPQGGM